MFDMLETRRSGELVLMSFPWIGDHPPFTWIDCHCRSLVSDSAVLMPGRAYMLNVPLEDDFVKRGFVKGDFAKISRAFLDGPSLAFARKKYPHHTLRRSRR